MSRTTEARSRARRLHRADIDHSMAVSCCLLPGRQIALFEDAVRRCAGAAVPTGACRYLSALRHPANALQPRLVFPVCKQGFVNCHGSCGHAPRPREAHSSASRGCQLADGSTRKPATRDHKSGQRGDRCRFFSILLHPRNEPRRTRRHAFRLRVLIHPPTTTSPPFRRRAGGLHSHAFPHVFDMAGLAVDEAHIRGLFLAVLERRKSPLRYDRFLRRSSGKCNPHGKH
jgi:hypothetical protein